MHSVESFQQVILIRIHVLRTKQKLTVTWATLLRLVSRVKKIVKHGLPICNRKHPILLPELFYVGMWITTIFPLSYVFPMTRWVQTPWTADSIELKPTIKRCRTHWVPCWYVYIYIYTIWYYVYIYIYTVYLYNIWHVQVVVFLFHLKSKAKEINNNKHKMLTVNVFFCFK